MLIEPEREEQVVAGDGIGSRDGARATDRGNRRLRRLVGLGRRSGRPPLNVASAPDGARGGVVIEVLLRAASSLRQALGEARLERQASSVGSAVDRSARAADVPAARPSSSSSAAARRASTSGPRRARAARSPTNGIRWRSTASRLIRSAAVFCDRDLADVGGLLVGRHRPAADDPLGLPTISHARW